MKKLFTFFVTVCALFIGQLAYAGGGSFGESKTYYAKGIVESKGNGTVYFENDSNEMVDKGTGELGSANVSFQVKITPDPGYKFWKFTFIDDNNDERDVEDFDPAVPYLNCFTTSTDENEPTVKHFFAYFVEDNGESEKETYKFEKTVSTGTFKYSTMVAPVDVTLPEGVVAYKVTGIEDGVIVKEAIAGTTVPAGTAVLLENTTNEDKTITAEFDESLLVEGDPATGLLHGSYVDFYTPVDGAYNLLFMPSVAFTKLNQSIPLKAFECYLAYDGEEESITLTAQEEKDPEPEPTIVEVEVTDAGYATTYFDTYVSIPSGVKVYTVKGVEGNSLTLVPVFGLVAPNCGVLIEASEGTYSFEEGNGLLGDNSMLQPVEKGYAIPASDEAQTNYVLQNQSGNVAFYKVVEEMTAWKRAAYLQIDAVSEVNAFSLNDAETAIKALNSMTSGKAEIFDMNGRKQSKLQKGVNIVNGVKILVK